MALIASFITGAIIALSVIRPLLTRPAFDTSNIVATIGLSVFLENFAMVFWGERTKGVPEFLTGSVNIVGTTFSFQRLAVVAVAALSFLFLWVYLKKTRLGMAIRATSSDLGAASLMGINTTGIYMATVGIGALLAGVAAIFMAPLYQIYPMMGIPNLLKAFVVVIFGGFGSIRGAIFGGYLIGIVEALATVAFGAEWKDIPAFVVLIVVLVLRPTGLFGAKV